jgi:dGTPase
MNWEKLLCMERPYGTRRKDALSSRNEFLRDFDRIVFSNSFRRLQTKTQVFPLPETDFIHTRLTHSLEASCVGRSLGALAGEILFKEEAELFKTLDIYPETIAAIVAAACLAHDIGNPPFGHTGEKAIGEYFKTDSGEAFIQDLDEGQRKDLLEFEGNAMGFRLLASTLPSHAEPEAGLYPTFATLGAFSKYPSESTALKTGAVETKKYGFFQSEKEMFSIVADKLGLIPASAANGAKAWKRHPLAFLVEAADDICYTIMDFEDGYKLKLVDFMTLSGLFKQIIGGDFDETRGSKIHDEREQLSFLRAVTINKLVSQAVEAFSENLSGIMNGSFDRPLLDVISSAKAFDEVKKISFRDIYSCEKVVKIEAAGFEVLSGLLQAFLPAVLKKDVTHRDKTMLKLLPAQFKTETSDSYQKILLVTQFVAGMTDTYAIDLFRTIKGISLPNY